MFIKTDLAVIVCISMKHCGKESLMLFYVAFSSFGEYSHEIHSGRLEWSPAHTSEKFWQDNAHRLNEKNFELVR